jgi:hypothetical protein
MPSTSLFGPDRSIHYELSDAEKRDLIKLIEQGKPLPEKYRFLLFADKREVELVWNGKTREVCTAVLPFQTLEHIDEPRKEQREQARARIRHGRPAGQGLDQQAHLGRQQADPLLAQEPGAAPQIEDAGGLKLIYIDPPFDVGADFSMDIEIGGETFHKEPNLLEQIAYRDTWGRGADSFIAMIYERLILMRDLMHSEGSIYLHCDTQKPETLLERILKPVATKAIWWRTSSAAAARPLQWPKSSGASGSPPTSASSASTPRASGSSKCSAS